MVLGNGHCIFCVRCHRTLYPDGEAGEGDNREVVPNEFFNGWFGGWWV